MHAQSSLGLQLSAAAFGGSSISSTAISVTGQPPSRAPRAAALLPAGAERRRAQSALA